MFSPRGAAGRLASLLAEARLRTGAGLDGLVPDRGAGEGAALLRRDAGVEAAADQVARRRRLLVGLRVAHRVVERRVFGTNPAGGVDVVVVAGRVVGGELRIGERGARQGSGGREGRGGTLGALDLAFDRRVGRVRRVRRHRDMLGKTRNRALGRGRRSVAPRSVRHGVLQGIWMAHDLRSLRKQPAAGEVRAERLAGGPDATTAPTISPPRDQPVGVSL